MEDYTRINSLYELTELKIENKRDTNILITKEFEFPILCCFLFECWKGNITFEKGIDTSNVEDMYGMFLECEGNIKGLEHFDTFNVENMDFMFSKIKKEIKGLECFDTSNVKFMRHMFYDVDFDNIKADLTVWDLSNLRYYDNMFSLTKNLPQKYIKHFSTEKVIKNILCYDARFKGE